jgi:sensor c-di-GMP phosphodiesterase-like protein
MLVFFKQRAFITLTAVLVLAATGALFGYLQGRSMTRRLAEGGLSQDSTRILSGVVAYLDESHAVLAAMNASKLPTCSDEEIANLRKVIFHAQFLRDAGHIRDGKIECSAVLGREDLPLVQFKPDITQPNGTKIYRYLPPYEPGGELVYSQQEGDSYVVRDPRLGTFMQGITNQDFTLTLIDVSRFRSGRVSGQPPKAKGAVTDRDWHGRLGDTLYATRCSARYFSCITAYSHLSDAMRDERGQLAINGGVGGFAGALLGFLVSLIYLRDRSVVQQLRRAIAEDRVRVVYQPIVELATGRIVGAEALARWTDEDERAVSPDVFVKIAEERGFVGDITALVLRIALRDFEELLHNHPEFRLSLNVAASDLADPGFLDMMQESLDQREIAAHNVAIEITESSTVRRAPAMKTIRMLRSKGHRILIDDFGTGYSNLSYLHDLSVDAIKIDRAFTQAVGTHSAVMAILPQILAMAKALSLQVIVEGIETDLQAEYFAGAGERILGQGRYFGAPVSPEAFERVLAENEQKSMVSAD